jgi:hypothetical protein
MCQENAKQCANNYFNKKDNTCQDIEVDESNNQWYNRKSEANSKNIAGDVKDSCEKESPFGHRSGNDDGIIAGVQQQCTEVSNHTHGGYKEQKVKRKEHGSYNGWI